LGRRAMDVQPRLQWQLLFGPCGNDGRRQWRIAGHGGDDDGNAVEGRLPVAGLVARRLVLALAHVGLARLEGDFAAGVLSVMPSTSNTSPRSPLFRSLSPRSH